MRSHSRLLLAAAITAGVIAPLDAQFGFLKGNSKVEYVAFRDPSQQFVLEYPKDWQVIGGAGDVVVSLAQKKNEAAVVVERFKMNTALAPQDVTDLFAQIETDVLKERQPKATEIASKVVDQNGHRLIVLDYSRVGVAGPERVRQYSFPIGQALYRLTCSAPTAQFAKYDPVFAHVADTFNAATAKTPAEDRP
jgi:hypothetical protein